MSECIHSNVVSGSLPISLFVYMWLWMMMYYWPMTLSMNGWSDFVSLLAPRTVDFWWTLEWASSLKQLPWLQRSSCKAPVARHQLLGNTQVERARWPLSSGLIGVYQGISNYHSHGRMVSTPNSWVFSFTITYTVYTLKFKWSSWKSPVPFPLMWNWERGFHK